MKKAIRILIIVALWIALHVYAHHISKNINAGLGLMLFVTGSVLLAILTFIIIRAPRRRIK